MREGLRAVAVLAILIASPLPASGQRLEVVEVTQQRFENPVTGGYLKHTFPSYSLFRMRVRNLRGPLGNICVDLLWFDASGLLDGEVACQSAPMTGPDIRTFTAVFAPAPPEDAELRVAFRHRTFSRFGDRIAFRGAQERSAPALFGVSQSGSFVCDTLEDLLHVGMSDMDDPETRSLVFRMIEDERCSHWPADTSVDVLGVQGDFALARAEGKGHGIMWIHRSFLE